MVERHAFSNQQNLIELLKEIEKEEEPYVYKIRCFSCAETPFRPFVFPKLRGDFLVFDGFSYPAAAIETIIIRAKCRYGIGKNDCIRTEYYYHRKVDRDTASEIFSEKMQKTLHEAHLL